MGPFEQDSLRSRLATDSQRSAWFESAALTCIGFALGCALRPDDPLFTESGFPWPIIVPILLGLRYGFAQAFIAAAALHLIAYLYSFYNPAATTPLPFGYSLGLLLTAMLAGEFRDIWGQRLQQLEMSNEYRQARMEEFTRAYHLLKISHDRLEQASAGDRTSLRSALFELRFVAQRNQSLPELANELLKLLRSYCNVQTAIVLPIEILPGGSAVLPTIVEPIAMLGNPAHEAIAADDALIVRALQTLQTTSIDVNNPKTLSNRKPGNPLICAPMIDALSRIHGLLIVTQLPFFAFNERNLQLLSIAAGTVADFFQTESLGMAAITAGVDETSLDFALHTRRCLKNAHDHGLPTALLAISFGDPSTAPSLIETIAGETRGLDLVHRVEGKTAAAVFLLLPLTERVGVDHFLLRLNTYLARQHGSSPGALGVRVEHRVLSAQLDTDALAQFASRLVGEAHPLVALLGADELRRQAA